ncbi:MAG: glycoside hydrolase family 47 protein [Bacteroidetes bacterium]|nr:glycoside hydrolase family 47 protein [Bacteroidota bacterium]MCW5894322.1 glycoside hydrolase family 47 protein [Bacteroidota bacterium]
MIVRLSLPVLMSVFVLSLAQTQTRTVTHESVKAEFLHAWNAYKHYARGHDAQKPLSRKPHNWYGTSLLMTPVDAFDTMILMGLKEEAKEAKKLILDSLSFDKDIEVQSFEITIRLLGGLLSAYQMDGDEKFLTLAEDLGNRLLPVFNSSTGMPYRYVHLQTGRIRDSLNNPAEIGTCLIEFGTLSKLTGKPVYYDKAKNALVQLYNRRSEIGLVGSLINVETGEWIRTTSHIAGGIDSYYEYLLKAALLFDDDDCRTMWEDALRSVNEHLADTTHGGLWYGQADMHTGMQTGTTFGSLDAFFPAVLAMGGDLERAAKLQESCLKMWNLHGIEPERIDYAKMAVTRPQYYLRPEIIESAYYLHHYTRDDMYLTMGETFFNGLVNHCRTDAGYAYLEDVVSKKQGDDMESFFLAETMKYLYLLFAPADTLPFDDIIFNTEAHPLRKTWKQ